MPKYYAAFSYYGTNATFSSGRWTVHVFDSKAERDQWVNDDPSTGTPRRTSVTSKEADRIFKAKPFEVDNRMYHEGGTVYRDDGTGHYEELR